MRKSRLAGLLILILLFTACGDKGESVSADTAVSADQSVESVTATPTEAPVAGQKEGPPPTPTEAESVSEDEAPEPPAAETHTLYATAEAGTNVRSGPGTEYELLVTLPKGEKVEALGEAENGWYELEYKGAKAYASEKYLSDKDPLAEEAAGDETAAAGPAPTEAGPETEPVPETPAAEPTPTPVAAPVVVTAPAGVLMIGDSRCVQMRDQSGGAGALWICENGKGYDWFVESAIPQADAIVGRGTKVAICLGVNDTDHGYSYASMINSLAATWGARGARVYFVSVNPVSDNPWTTIEEVQGFNNYMITNLAGVPYIDTYSYLVAHGYNMIDGMHFDAPTNMVVLNLILANLR